MRELASRDAASLTASTWILGFAVRLRRSRAAPLARKSRPADAVDASTDRPSAALAGSVVSRRAIVHVRERPRFAPPSLTVPSEFGRELEHEARSNSAVTILDRRFRQQSERRMGGGPERTRSFGAEGGAFP
jgi:hypothetical protein